MGKNQIGGRGETPPIYFFFIPSGSKRMMDKANRARSHVLQDLINDSLSLHDIPCFNFFFFWTLKTGLTRHLGPVHPSLAHRHVTSSCAYFLDFGLLSNGTPLTTRVQAHAPACN